MKFPALWRPFILRELSREPKLPIFPCVFPDNQGINPREQFAADCVIHTSVFRLSDLPENRAKTARVRGIFDQERRADLENTSQGAILLK